MGRHASTEPEPLVELFERAMIRIHANNGNVLDEMVGWLCTVPRLGHPTVVGDLGQTLATHMTTPKLAAVCAHALIRLALHEQENSTV